MPDFEYQDITAKDKEDAYDFGYGTSILLMSIRQIGGYYDDSIMLRDEGRLSFDREPNQFHLKMYTPKDYLSFYCAIRAMYDSSKEHDSSEKALYEKYIKAIADDMADYFGFKKGKDGVPLEKYYNEVKKNHAIDREESDIITDSYNITKQYGTDETLDAIANFEIVQDRREKFTQLETNISELRTPSDKSYIEKAQKCFDDITDKNSKSQEGKEDKEIEKNRLGRLYSDLSNKKNSRTWKDWFGISKIINNIAENRLLKNVKNALAQEHNLKEEDFNKLTSDYGTLKAQKHEDFKSVSTVDGKLYTATSSWDLIEKTVIDVTANKSKAMTQEKLANQLKNDTTEKSKGDLSKSNLSNNSPQIEKRHGLE